MTPADWFTKHTLARQEVAGLLVRELTVKERAELESQDLSGSWDRSAEVVHKAAINEDGTPFFGPDDLAKIKNDMPSSVVQEIAFAVMILSRGTKDGQESAEKNLEATPSGGSFSD